MSVENIPVNDVSSTVRPLTPADFDAGILPRVRTVVETQPGRIAVADGERELTFLGLATEAAGLLVGLRQVLHRLDPPPAPGGPETFSSLEPVAVLHAHACGAVSAMLAVLASGHPLVMLDPKTPAPRLRQFVERVGIRVVIADDTHLTTAAGLVEKVMIAERDARDAPAAALWELPPEPHVAALIGFTSGSTGRPKPVVNDHRMVVRDAYANTSYSDCYGAHDVIAHTLPMAFHAGLIHTVAGVLVGTTMRLYDVRSHGIATLPGFIAANRATVVHASPAILRALVGSGPDPAQLATLRRLTFAGEAAHGADIQPLRALIPPGCELRNRYGSTETGQITEHVIRPEDPPLQGMVPSGRACADSVLGLVDDTGAPVPPGGTGTVTVTAGMTATGYWDEPGATEKSFADNPDGTRTFTTSDVGHIDPDGTLHLLGRRDHSVKVRGYLVDPGEVDAVLFALPEVREAVVVGVDRGAGQAGKRLVAYVASTSERPSAAGIRAAVRGVLPGHMVPETIVFLDALPRTDRGKIDRAALPEAPPPVTAGAGGEMTHWEELVAEIWADVLELEKVGRDDDFFELGGDSLAAEALVSRVISDLGTEGETASTSLLIQSPTVGAFASALRADRPTPTGVMVPLQIRGTLPPLFLMAGGGGLGVAFVPWARRLGPDQPTWAVQARALESRGLPDWSVQSVARRNVAAIRRVQPRGPYYLAGHSFGGLVALEMAHQLRAAGHEVALLAILDSFPPEPELHPKLEERSTVQRIKDTAGLTLMALRSTPGGRQHWRFYNQSGRLALRYRCRPYSGRTLVVVADSPEKDIRAAWEPHLTGEWEMVEVAGDHITMTRKPWSDEVADVLAAALARARVAG